MEILEKYFTEFTEKQLNQFKQLQELYSEWNSKINVISRKDIDSFYEHHVLHSLAIATQFDFPKGFNIMDLGAGGGFPGIPLAIFFPEVNFLLVDSINKKLKVVQEISQAIGLTNVQIRHTRAEDIKDKKFDVVVSRAVAPLKDLWYWSRPLLKQPPVVKTPGVDRISGLISLKGGDLNNEISESGTRPRIWPIDAVFEEEYFKEKFILNVPLA